jgi:tetratricopeptide (TPR) repeat protein
MNIQPSIVNLPSNPDSPNINPFQTSSSNDDEDDDMALGDEAAGGVVENLSDEDGHVSRSINVSPSVDEDSDTQEKPLTNSIDHNKQNHINDDDEENDSDDHPNSKNYSSYNKQNTLRNNMQNSSINDAISNSNFGSIIQSWLRDLVELQPNRYVYDRPWSKSSRPWSLDKIQRDIERFNRYNDYKNAIEVSKKMLQNGVLDYHYYAECIAETLIICAHAYLKLFDYSHAIQYASEALQYNKNDGNPLMYRGKAFENEKL